MVCCRPASSHRPTWCGRLAEVGYLADEGLATAAYLGAAAAPAAVLRGRGRRRQDRAGQGAGRRARRAADPAAVLRGHRRRPRRSTTGTSRASCCTCAPPRRPADGRRRTAARGRAVQRAGSWSPGRCCRRWRPTPVGAAGRRGRPGRRRVRGVPARGALATSRSPCRSSARSGPRCRRPSCSPRNRTRDVHDALKRRCLYHWLDHPEFDREVAIVRLRVPEASDRLARAGHRRRARAARRATCSSRPASPRPWTGPRRCVALGAPRARPGTRRRRPSARSLKYREDPSGSAPSTSARWSTRAVVRLRPAPQRRRTADAGRRRAGRAAPRTLRAGRGRRRAPDRVAGRPRRAGRRSTRAGATDLYWAGRLTLCASPDDLAATTRSSQRYFAGDAPRHACAGPRHLVRAVPLALAVADAGAGADEEDDGGASRRAAAASTRRDAAAHGRRRRSARPSGPSWTGLLAALSLPGESPPVPAPPALAAPRRRRPAPHRPGAAARRRRAGPARTGPGARSGRGGWCCWSTSAARWRPTPTRCCASRTPPPGRRGARHRGVHARHPADPGHPGAGRTATRTRRWPRSPAAVPGLVRRHPARRAAAGVPRPLGAARHGPRRGRRDPVRRLGARRPGRCSATDGAGCTAGRTGWCGQPAQGRPGFAPLAGGHGRGAAARGRLRRRAQPGGAGAAGGGRRREWRCAQCVTFSAALRSLVRQPGQPVRAGHRRRDVGAARRGPRARRWRSSPDGEVVGSVSGGCVEGAVYELAQEVLETASAGAADLRLQRRRTRSRSG